MKRAAPPAVLLVVVSLLVLSTADARLQQQPNPADRFEVSDVMIPMRDGKRLNTKIFTPRLRQGSGEPLPIIFKRTPYGIQGAANNFNAYYKALADEGYIFVHQDIRGKFESEGEFVMQRPARLRQGSGEAGSGRRVPKHPLIVIAHSTNKDELLKSLEEWKEQHPRVVEHLQPADVMTDQMRGRSSAWWRIRINLQHVPEALRPEAPKLPPIPNPWENATPEQIAEYREMHRKRRQARKPE